MNPLKFNNVIQMDGESRYSYFVRKVVDSECLWGLECKGWAMAEDEQKVKLLPFWPEEAFAQACAEGAWSGYSARKIDLENFLSKWLEGMQRDGIKAAVFPTPEDRGVVVEANILQSALMSEGTQYE